MVQFQVVDDTDEDISVDATASLPVVERLAAGVLEAAAGQLATQVVFLLA